MYQFPGSRPKKGLSSNGFTKTVSPINVRGGQVSDWEESQVLAALAVSELSAALQ